MSRGVFEADRLKLALHLTHDLFPTEIPEIEWNVFVGRKNIGKSEIENTPPWIPKHCTIACQALQVMKVTSFILFIILYRCIYVSFYCFWCPFFSLDSI